MKKSAFILILMTLVKVTNGQQINLKDSALEADYIACINSVYLLKDQTMEGAVVRNNSSSVVSQFNDPESGSFTDPRDGQTYKWVKIGDQVWMAENLRVGLYKNGDTIPTNLPGILWRINMSGAYEIYPHKRASILAEHINGINSSEEMVAVYGKLYNWFAVDDPRGLCPEGWRVPSDLDWGELENYIIGQGYENTGLLPLGAGNALKSCRQVNSLQKDECDTSVHPRWGADENHRGFDKFGFSALPGGYRYNDAIYYDIGDYGIWWTSTEENTLNAWFRGISRSYGNIHRGNVNKRGGYSIRCIKNMVSTEHK